MQKESLRNNKNKDKPVAGHLINFDMMIYT